MFAALLLIGFVAWASVLPLVAWSAQWRWRWRCLAFRQWARANAVLLGMDWQASGNVPRETTMLVANHLSYLDVIALALRCDAVFVAKSEIAHWPLIGFLARCMGTIFIERRRKRDILRVNALITSALRNGQSVIVFPEGTTSDGATVLPFKSSLLEPAVKLGVPVHCASLHYATAVPDESAATSVCWWGEMDFVPHLWRLFQLKGFSAAVHFGATPLLAADRKTLARIAQARIAATLQTMQMVYHQNPYVSYVSCAPSELEQL
jgi:1-acyl-sn-glycerol-3-phosphate acyltransferase